MRDAEHRFASILADLALVEKLVPYPCPAPFGPEDRYTLLELIGMGRESLVYRASDSKLASDGFPAHVAIKIVRGTRTPKEALAVRRVRHPNVVAMYDHGRTVEGDVYFVMEHVEGRPLSELPLPLEAKRAARIMEQVAQAVQAIHAAGLVHCDLKPANIVIDAEDRVKVLDLDLAKWASDEDSQRRGNLAFMAPEQFRGGAEALTPLADVYALGGLLHFLVTGRLPHGETPEAIRAWHAAPRTLAGGGPRTLVSVIQTAMASAPEERYFAAAAMAQDLRAWLDHRPPPNLKTSTPRQVGLWIRRRPVHAIGAGLVMLALLAVPTAMAAAARYEHAQAAEIERITRERTAVEIATLKANLRAPIVAFGRMAAGTDPNESEVLAVPAFLAIDRVLDHPMLGPDGLTLSAEARIPWWTKRLALSVQRGSDGDAETAIIRLALATDYLQIARPADAIAELAVLRKSAIGRIPLDDAIWDVVDVLESAAAAIDPARSESERQHARSLVESALESNPNLQSRFALRRALQTALDLGNAP